MSCIDERSDFVVFVPQRRLSRARQSCPPFVLPPTCSADSQSLCTVLRRTGYTAAACLNNSMHDQELWQIYNTHVAKLSLSVRRRAVKSSFLSMCDAGMLNE